MNGHIADWIDAYLDGELPPLSQKQVEGHLAACPSCRRLAEQRRALSALLQEAPALGAAALKEERQFAAEVGLRLPRQPDAARQRRSQVLRQVGWRLFPVTLLLIGIFVEIVFFLSRLVEFIPGADQTLTSLPVLSVPLPGAVRETAGMLGLFGFLNFDWITGFILLGAAGLMYLGWLAAWWARSQQNAAGRI